MDRKESELKEGTKMCERVSVANAAKEIGCSPQKVREKMKRGKWKLGRVEPPEKGVRSTYEYFIFRNLLNKHLGLDK